jgi:hypothetical protein
MAKRYNAKDQAKMVSDKLSEMNAKGTLQVGSFTPLHPGGAVEAIREMSKDASLTKAQSQSQIEQGKEALKRSSEQSKAMSEEQNDRRKRG